MLKIFYGRENINKEQFMYENLTKPALILVPDQYTLEGEKQAMKYLGTNSLMDVEIMSISRLGDRVLEKLGGKKTTLIDKYGRHILLSKILREEKENLKSYNRVADKTNFIEAINNFISQLKQYGGNSQSLGLVADCLGEGRLKEKLQDLVLVTKRYEEALGAIGNGTYLDSEDYVDLYLDKLGDYKPLKESQIWIYGFDSFAPKTLAVIERIIETSPNTNVIMTWDKACYDEEVFKLTDLVIESLKEIAQVRGIECQVQAIEEIDKKYIRAIQNPAIDHIEKELYAIPYKKMGGRQPLTLVRSANPYNEAETAAAYILKLVREKGLRFRDIQVVCNDQDNNGGIIERVFNEYGIKLFIDKKRDIINSQIIISILALLDVIKSDFRTNGIMDFIKSGFSPLSVEEVERLENYGYKYKIRGTMWKREFKLGLSQYEKEGLEELENMRKVAIEPLIKLEKIAKDAATIEDFSKAFCQFLDEEIQLPARIEKLVEYQENHLGHQGKDMAGETKQIWSSFITVVEQIVLLLGNDKFQMDEYVKLLEAGLREISIGVLPPTADGVLMGTTQRSRTGDAKAVIVLTANEGILPVNPADNELFDPEEIKEVAQQGGQIGKLDSVRIQEEKLAIYRTFAKATDYLMVSTCTADSEGGVLRTSPVFSKLEDIFPDTPVVMDILNRNDRGSTLDLLGGKINILRHLTNHLQEATITSEIDDIWKEVLLWFKDSDEVRSIEAGIGFTNEQKNIDKERIEKLFFREGFSQLILSPSRLEGYSRCPFSFLINYGLKAEERRVFEIDARGVGDVYHDTLMDVMEELSREAIAEGKSVTEKDSRLMTISKEDLYAIVEEKAKARLDQYQEGLFQSGATESYRSNHIITTCKEIAWNLVLQARRGDIVDVKLEEGFGRGESLKPITVKLDDGKTVLIEGRIDRVDTLPGNKVKIIDYKTGDEHFSKNEAEKGYRLQLMLYLKAAQGNNKVPAGVFYFLIKEPMLDLDKLKNKSKEAIATEMFKLYKMNGLLVDDEDTIKALDKNVEGHSQVIPYQATKDGGKGSIVTRDEMVALQDVIDKKIKDLCKELLNGEIPLRPMKVKTKSACTYCKFKGICRFDTVFEGCNYEII